MGTKHSISRLERLLKLAAALLNTDRLMPASEIQERVQGYPENLTAFRRMFERDKADLREMGIPIMKAPVPGSELAVEGYRIRRKDYAFRDPGFTEDERAALYLAAQSVRLKDIQPEAAVWALGGRSQAKQPPPMSVLPAGEHLFSLYSAVTQRRTATFTYRGEERQTEPLRLVFTRGHWYLIAYDRERSALRHFRLDRLEALELGKEKEFETRPVGEEGLGAPAWEFGSEYLNVRLSVSEEMADWVLNQFDSPKTSEQVPNGDLTLELRVANPEPFLDFVLSLLEHGEILSPPELREQLLTRLRAVAATAGSSLPPLTLAEDDDSERGGEDASGAPERKRKLSQLERLQRMLQLVPWVTERGGAQLEKIAESFDYPAEMLLNDLQNVLFMVGVPPYTPDALIEVAIDENGWVHIAHADFFSKPLYLTPEQAFSLLAAGTALATFEPSKALKSGLSKLADLLGAEPGEVVKVELGKGEVAFLDLLRDACRNRQKVGIDYYSYNRDSFGKRSVRPYRLFAKEGYWYIQGYCETAEDERTFRLDRVIAAEALPENFDPPAGPVPASVWKGDRGLPWIELRLSREALWALEYYPASRIRSSEEGCLVRFAVSALPWLERMLLRLGNDVEVISSFGLPENPGAAAAKRILARYEKQP